MKSIKDIISSNHVPKPLPTDLEFLDDNLGGLYPGEMTIICGEADSGKTALIIRMIHHIAIEKEVPVLILLNWMSEHTLLACMTAYYCNIKTSDIHEVLLNPTYTDYDVEDYLKLLEKKPIYFSDVKELKENGIDSLKEIITSKGIKAIFSEQTDEYHVDPDHAVFLLKRLAKETQSTVIAESEDWCRFLNLPTTLRDISSKYKNYADSIVGIYAFDTEDYLDGRINKNLLGHIKLKILKHKGVVSSGKETIIRKDDLFFRNKEIVYINESTSVINSNPSVKSLMDRFDCEITSPY